MVFPCSAIRIKPLEVILETVARPQPPREARGLRSRRMVLGWRLVFASTMT